MFLTWLMISLGLIVVELLTVNLVCIWFAIGAFFAGLTTFITDSNVIQIIVFLVVSVVALFLTRPLVKKYLVKDIEKTNYDKVIGMVGIVTKDIGKLEYGEVKVDGKYWTAKADKKIKEGSKVEILSIEGVKLVVKERKEND